jgi:schlafen family protein
MNAADLLARLSSGHSSETSFIERKPESVKRAELRREACAFANSVPDGEEAVIFIGLHDKTGAPTGITNMDSLQERVHDALKSDCYPPIEYSTQEIPYQGNTVLALVIPASRRKPHFTGPAFVREGSRTRNASDELLRELLLSQIDKCREILRWKGKGLVTVMTDRYKLGSKKPMSTPHTAHTECLIQGCTAHVVSLEEPATGNTYHESLAGVVIGHDDERRRLMLIVSYPRP